MCVCARVRVRVQIGTQVEAARRMGPWVHFRAAERVRRAKSENTQTELSNVCTRGGSQSVVDYNSPHAEVLFGRGERARARGVTQCSTLLPATPTHLRVSTTALLYVSDASRGLQLVAYIRHFSANALPCCIYDPGLRCGVHPQWKHLHFKNNGSGSSAWRLQDIPLR